jgi:DNA invertase Pin-like site-specific DNA recombinase
VAQTRKCPTPSRARPHARLLPERVINEQLAKRRKVIRGGGPPAMTAEQIRLARDLLTRPDNTVSSIARLLGVSRATVYRYVPELPAGPRHTAALPRAQ